MAKNHSFFILISLSQEYDLDEKLNETELKCELLCFMASGMVTLPVINKCVL